MDPLLPYTAAVDRAAHLRGRADAVAALMADAAARFIPVWRDLHPVDADGRPHILGPEALPWAGAADAAVVFLGRADGRSWFALSLPDSDAPPDLGRAATFVSLRAFGAALPGPDAALFAAARALVIWHRTHPRCSRCGAPTHPTDAGHSRTCGSAACAHRTFPRTDPAVIVLVTRGESCLLGRQPQWAPGVYSTIAGFVEPGETIESAVRREVAEETGVRVGAVRYLASQPWPFPASLMLGFRGEALTADIARGADELEDCRWFTRDEVRTADKDGGPLLLPHRSSISRWLIESWRDEA